MKWGKGRGMRAGERLMERDMVEEEGKGEEERKQINEKGRKK